MTRARDIANLVDANGDIVAGALDNVPASNDASALTTGTLAAARLPSSGVDASSLSTGTLAAARLPSSGIDAASITTGLLAKAQLPTNHIQQMVFAGNNYGATSFPQNATFTPFWSGTITPTYTNSIILILGLMEVELNGGNYPSINLHLRRGTTHTVAAYSIRGYEGAENNHSIFEHPVMYIDAPNTTSPQAYYYYGANSSGSTYTGTYGGRGNAYNNSYALLIELKGS